MSPLFSFSQAQQSKSFLRQEEEEVSLVILPCPEKGAGKTFSINRPSLPLPKEESIYFHKSLFSPPWTREAREYFPPSPTTVRTRRKPPDRSGRRRDIKSENPLSSFSEGALPPSLPPFENNKFCPLENTLPYRAARREKKLASVFIPNPLSFFSTSHKVRKSFF